MNHTASTDVGELNQQRDWLLMTLSCIGDAVVTTDFEGRITFLNPVAETLTGWTQAAVGLPLEHVIRMVNEETRQPVETPNVQALGEGRLFKLANHSLLIAKDDTELPISDSAALIRNIDNEVAGLVMVFEMFPIAERWKRILHSRSFTPRTSLPRCENHFWFWTAT